MIVATGLDLDQLRSWLGREETATDLVTSDLVRKYRATLDLPPGELEEGAPAPPLLHWCLSQPADATSSLGADGHPRRGGFLPPVPLPRRMWAGGRLSFHSELPIGRSVQRRSRIADVSIKEGRSGPLCFVVVEHEFAVDGHVILNETQDIVYRGPDAAATEPAAQASAAPTGLHRREIDPLPPLLFRYSALTFNGHRIHYDLPYVTVSEGYPGLVVHGPLQATLLFNFATELQGKTPTNFSFRSQSPLFDTGPFFLNAGQVEGGVMKLWTARANGPYAMTAQANWS